jgi:hypothetical protein
VDHHHALRRVGSHHNRVRHRDAALRPGRRGQREITTAANDVRAVDGRYGLVVGWAFRVDEYLDRGRFVPRTSHTSLAATLTPDQGRPQRRVVLHPFVHQTVIAQLVWGVYG